MPAKIPIDTDFVRRSILEGRSTTEIAKILNVNSQLITRAVRTMVFPEADDRYIRRRPSAKPLTQTEFDVLIGGLLGDTWIGYGLHSQSASGSFTHKIEHKEYVQYKYSYLKRLCSPPTTHNKHDHRSNRRYIQAFCKIAANPILNEIADKFYHKGVKRVCTEYLHKLTPLGVAIWFMDDGCKDQCGYKIAVNCFSKKDVIILRDFIRSYGLQCNHQSTMANLYIPKESKDDFTKMISPFVPPVMRYKLHALDNKAHKGNTYRRCRFCGTDLLKCINGKDIGRIVKCLGCDQKYRVSFDHSLHLSPC